MNNTEFDSIQLIGISPDKKTTNANGQSAIDCGNLWQEFEKGNYIARIPGKSSERIYAVYHDYEGDHTQPYSYFIGCEVQPGTIVPDGLNSLVIPKGTYTKIEAKGQMPDCVADAWRSIWTSDISRAYRPDFEIYDHRSKDWQSAEVDIFISI